MMIHRRTLGLGIMVLTPLLWLIGVLVHLSPPVRAQTLPDPVFVGAGDIAECDTAYDEATAKLLDIISGTIYTIGDTVYSDGTPQEFTDCFGPTWGRHRARIKPAPGNHDYHTPGRLVIMVTLAQRRHRWRQTARVIVKATIPMIWAPGTSLRSIVRLRLELAQNRSSGYGRI